MPKRTISDVQLERLLRDGKGVSEIGRILKVTPGAVTKAIKRMRVAVTKDVSLRSAPEVVGRGLDVLSQLEAVNRDAREILDLVMRWQRGEPEALRVLENQRRVLKYGEDGTEEEVVQLRLKDPRELALRAMAEIRNQLEFQHKIIQSLYELKNVAEFQHVVITVIGSVSPEARQEIIRRLTERNAIASSLSLPRPPLL